MDTRIWGPSGWELLHHIAANYNHTTKKKAKQYIVFFNNLHIILPCRYCRESYKEYIGISPFVSNNDKDISKNLFKIHNMVNKKLDSQGYVVRYESKHSVIWKKYRNQMCDDIGLGFTFIGCCVANYPIKNPSKKLKSSYAKFFNLLPTVYGNEIGRKMWSEYLESKPIELYLDSRKKLQNWFNYSPLKIDHLGKSTISETSKLFDTYRAGCRTKSCRKRGAIAKKFSH